MLLAQAATARDATNAPSDPPHSKSPNRGDALSTTGERVPPVFPEEYGAGLRPLRSVTGEGRAVVLLVDFPDRPANYIARPGPFYDDLLFSRGTHSTGSLRDFYLEVSYGAYEVTGEVHGWFRTFENHSTFDDGNYGLSGGAQGLVLTTLVLADPTVDFGKFDADGPDGVPNSGDDDGIVDACIVFHAGLMGPDTFNSADFWPYATKFSPPFDTDDPRVGGGYVQIDGFSIQPEMVLDSTGVDTLQAFFGITAHEYGHLLGLPDLYDSGGPTWGVGYWDLMGYGSAGAARTGPYHMSAWSKIALGWVAPIVVSNNMYDVTIPPAETAPVVYKVWRDGIPGQEYFLLENRQNVGFDSHLPGHGLLIWHVDETMFSAAAARLVPHASGGGGWFRIALEQADGLNHMTMYYPLPNRREYFRELGDSGDPYPGDSLNTHFDGFSDPSSRDNTGFETDVSIVDILEEGSDIRLSIIIDSTTVAIYFRGFRAEVVDAGVRLTWDVQWDEPIDGFRLYRSVASKDGEPSIPRGGMLPPSSRTYVDGDVQPDEHYRYMLTAVRPDGSEARSQIVTVSTRPVPLALYQNRPNPFNPKTTIAFSVPRDSWVNITVFDVAGRLIRTLESKLVSAGLNDVEWDGRDGHGNPVDSGVYFYRLKTEGRVVAQKMVLLR